MRLRKDDQERICQLELVNGQLWNSVKLFEKQIDLNEISFLASQSSQRPQISQRVSFGQKEIDKEMKEIDKIEKEEDKINRLEEHMIEVYNYLKRLRGGSTQDLFNDNKTL